MKILKDPIAFQYEVNLSVPGIQDHTKNIAFKNKKETCLKSYNKIWGFKDGNCNFKDKKTGALIPKSGGEDPDFVQGHYAITRSHNIKVLVSVRKSGKRVLN